jgi:transposase InsO family protein
LTRTLRQGWDTTSAGQSAVFVFAFRPSVRRRIFAAKSARAHTELIRVVSEGDFVDYSRFIPIEPSKHRARLAFAALGWRFTMFSGTWLPACRSRRFWWVFCNLTEEDIRVLLTDKGSSYRSTQFRATCLEMQLKHRRTKPYTPRTNGNAERFIQTALREWPMPNTGPTRAERCPPQTMERLL